MDSIKIDLSWPARKAKALVQRFRTKADPALQTLLMTLGGNPLWSKKDIARLAKSGYQNCSTVYACVNLIVEAAAAVPWQLFKRPAAGDTKKE